jgi:hypothetical protein
VKQREDESYFHKSTLRQESRDQDLHSETCDAEESSSAPSELELPLMTYQFNNLDHIRREVKITRLQERPSRY